MKKDRILKLCTTACLVLGIVMNPAGQLEARAAEVIATVQGTVSTGTTSDLLKLSTKEGNMEIKIDGRMQAAVKYCFPTRKSACRYPMVLTDTCMQ